MAVQAPIPRFAPGEIVSCDGQGQYIVLSISNEIEFNLYHLIETNTGEKRTCSAMHLEKNGMTIEEEKKEDAIEIEEGINEEKNEKKRFKTLSEQELDDLQRRRTEPSTDKQMRWAVRIFKGKKFTKILHYMHNLK